MVKVPVVCIPVIHIKYALTSHTHTGIIFEIYMYLETYTKSWRAAEQSKPNINRYVYKKIILKRDLKNGDLMSSGSLLQNSFFYSRLSRLYCK